MRLDLGKLSEVDLFRKVLKLRLEAGKQGGGEARRNQEENRKTLKEAQGRVCLKINEALSTTNRLRNEIV